MILFKPEHVAPILASTKTQTRRMGQKRWNVGAVHQAKTRLFGTEPFAHLRILGVSRERLLSLNDADAIAEGYPTRRQYLIAFAEINGVDVIPEGLFVWVVHFELGEAVAA